MATQEIRERPLRMSGLRSHHLGALAFDGFTLSPRRNRKATRDLPISEAQSCFDPPLGLSGALIMRVAAEGPAAISRLSYFAARSSNRRLVNWSALSARLRQRSACAFKKFVSMMSPTQHVQLCTAHRLNLQRGRTVNTFLTITFWGFHMRGTRLRARETGGLSMVPGGKI